MVLDGGRSIADFAPFDRCGRGQAPKVMEIASEAWLLIGVAILTAGSASSASRTSDAEDDLATSESKVNELNGTVEDLNDKIQSDADSLKAEQSAQTDAEAKLEDAETDATAAAADRDEALTAQAAAEAERDAASARATAAEADRDAVMTQLDPDPGGAGRVAGTGGRGRMRCRNRTRGRKRDRANSRRCARRLLRHHSTCGTERTRPTPRSTLLPSHNHQRLLGDRASTVCRSAAPSSS
jgi:hypothetical protein